VFFRERVPFTKKITPLCVSVSTGGGGSGQHISQHFFSGVLPAWYQDFSGAGGQIHVHIRLFVVQNRASQELSCITLGVEVASKHGRKFQINLCFG
jgi:hypothetical protein